MILASDDDLETIEASWPANRRRWPEPNSSSAMSKVRLQNYAALAKTRKEYYGWFSELILLLASGALGFQIPAITRAIEQNSTAWTNFIQQPTLPDATPLYFGWLESLGNVGITAWPIVLGALAVRGRSDSSNFARMERAYDNAADAVTVNRPIPRWLRFFVPRRATSTASFRPPAGSVEK